MITADALVWVQTLVWPLTILIVAAVVWFWMWWSR